MRREEPATLPEAAWPSDEEKLIFTYLRGELVRRAGRGNEAIKALRKVLAQYPLTGPDWRGKWPP